MNVDQMSNKPQSCICYWWDQEVKQRIQKLHSIGSIDCLEVMLVFIILKYLLISSKHILTY